MGYKKLHKNQKLLKLSSYDNYQELPKLDFNSFPLIDDFEIMTKDCGKSLGIHIYFYKNIGNGIASFA